MTSIHDSSIPFNHNSQLSKLPQINRINFIRTTTSKNTFRKNTSQKKLFKKKSFRKKTSQKNILSKNIPQINNKYTSEKNIYYLENQCKLRWQQNKLLKQKKAHTKLITKYKQLIQDPFNLEDSGIDINNLYNNKSINLVYHTEKAKTTAGFVYNLYSDIYVNSNTIFKI